MDITPPIRTAPSAPSRVDYERYLQSAGWRTRRNAKLKAASWRCERCGAKRGLQVHHRTYERLGHEYTSDLEALCADCHAGEHVQAMHDDPTGRVYLVLAREVLRDRVFDCFADLVEEMKSRCASLKLPYNAHQVDKALGLLSGETRFARVPATHEERTEAYLEQRPFSAAESRALLYRLFSGPTLIKTMPRAGGEDPNGIDLYAPVPNPNWCEHDRY